MAASIMQASDRAVRSAWVSVCSEFVVAAVDWGMRKNKLVGNKQVYAIMQRLARTGGLSGILRTPIRKPAPPGRRFNLAVGGKRPVGRLAGFQH
jgi:hypothetical protein